MQPDVHSRPADRAAVPSETLSFFFFSRLQCPLSVNRSLVKYLPVFLFLLSFFIRFTGNLLTVSLHSSSSFSLHKKKKVARGTFETTFFCKLPKFVVDVNIRELVAAFERSLLAVQEVHKKKKKRIQNSRGRKMEN